MITGWRWRIRSALGPAGSALTCAADHMADYALVWAARHGSSEGRTGYRLAPDRRAKALAALSGGCHTGLGRPSPGVWMFGVVRPCRDHMSGALRRAWQAHLCGLCLTLRDTHGQAARLVTGYDALLVSVLTEAQNPQGSPHRTAGPCPLRGFRRADVVAASAPGAQLAASVSLVLAAVKIADHVADADGLAARQPVAAAASRVAARGGRVSGRMARLRGAFEDWGAVRRSGRYNPLLATGTSAARARAYCNQALLGLRLAVASLDLADRPLAEALLVTEVGRSVNRVFAHAGTRHGDPDQPPAPADDQPQQPPAPADAPPQDGVPWSDIGGCCCDVCCPC